MDRDPTERRPTEEDKFSARVALWMGLTVFLFGVGAYALVTFAMPELSQYERYSMKFLCAVTSLFGALFVSWKPTHEGDDLD